MRSLIFMACLVLTVSVGIQAQEKVLFRYNPLAGEVVKYIMNTNIDAKGETPFVMDITIVMTQTAQPKSIHNTFILNNKIESIKMYMNPNNTMMSHNTDNPDNSNPMGQAFPEQFAPLLDATYNHGD